MNIHSPLILQGKKHATGPQLVMFALLVLPFLGTVYALFDAQKNGVSWFFPVLAFVMYAYTGLGITVGFHRLFTHESFTATKALRWFLGVGGLMALQGTIATWCGKHHTHHTQSDKPGKDPHTPYEYGYSWSGLWKGFWHAHFGWLLLDKPMEPNATHSRLRGDHLIATLDRQVWFWIVMSFALPTLAGLVYTRTLEGAWLGLLWGGAVRLFVVQHVTWSVNSVCHMWGRRPFKTRDWSRDNWIVAYLGFGEGNHNGHHAFMRSPCHNIDRPWLDISYVCIRFFEAVGLASGSRENLPPPETVEKLRIE
jgi:stearoyl-CoA desaturase (delta-9 desaturase)